MSFVNHLITNNKFLCDDSQMFTFCYFINIIGDLYDYYSMKCIFLLEICKI